MTDFDQARAIREEIVSLTEVKKVLGIRKRELEQRYAEVEVEFNTVSKLEGFASAELDRKRKVLAELEK